MLWCPTVLNILGNRRDVALKQMNHNYSLAAIFTKEAVSDWDDNQRRVNQSASFALGGARHSNYAVLSWTKSP